MRQGPLDITAILFGDVRAGRAAARSVVPETFPDSSSAGSVPTAQELLMLPGTDGKHSCGTWSRSGESEGLPLRLSGAFEDGHAGEASMASRPASQAMPRRHVESKRRV